MTDTSPTDGSLVGARVRLRYPQEADREPYLQMCRDSAAFMAPWSPTQPPDVDPYASAAFDLVLDCACSDRRHGLLIVRREDDALLGVFNINEIVRGCFNSAYLGYWIGSSAAGQGYMTEAMGLGLAFAFDDLGLHRVEANIMPRNVPSTALVERAGFRREGLSVRYLKIAGSWEDHVRWAMTVEDWRAC